VRSDRAAGAVGAEDRGSATVEMLVLVVAFFGFIAMIVFVGRVTVGYAHVEAAARAGARTISLARDPDRADAEVQARADASSTAREGSAMCRSMSFVPTIDPDADPVTVEVEVSCVVDLSEALLVDGVPGTFTVSATAVEVVDRYRETGT
jgi:Flp pilus assembly protein TadG